MVDTQRALSALQALFADNVTKDISEQDLRDFLVSTHGAFNVRTMTASGSLTDDDQVVVVDATSGSVTVTLNPVDDRTGKLVLFCRSDTTTNAVSIVPDAGDTIAGGSSLSITNTLGVTGVLSPGSGTDWSHVFHHPISPGHGSILAVDGVTAQTGIAQTPVLLTGWTANSATPVGCTPDYTADSISLEADGAWTVSCTLAFSGSNGTTFTVELYLDGSPTTAKLVRKLGANGDVGSAALFANIDVVGQPLDLELYVVADAGTKEITMEQASLNVVKVG